MKYSKPRRSEIWIVDFNPTIGAEINKQRPALVISSDSIGKLPLKIVAPITNWKEEFVHNIWHIRLCPNPENGLDKESTVDLLQVRSVDINRFIKLIGRVKEDQIEEAVQSLGIIIEIR